MRFITELRRHKELGINMRVPQTAPNFARRVQDAAYNDFVSSHPSPSIVPDTVYSFDTFETSLSPSPRPLVNYPSSSSGDQNRSSSDEPETDYSTRSLSPIINDLPVNLYVGHVARAVEGAILDGDSSLLSDALTRVTYVFLS